MNTEKCKEWAKDRLSPSPKNPLTNRKIKVGGPKYKELDKDCEELVVDINSVCMKWLKDNHSDLYLKLGKKQPKIKKSPVVPKKALVPVAPPQPPSISSSILTNDSDEIEPQFFYTIEDRSSIGNVVKNYFESVIIADGKACMTQNKTLLRFVGTPKLLGYGSFGNVYGAQIPKTKISVAIKEGRISAAELKKAMVKNYPLEYLYNKLINDLLDDKVCPNFSYTYAIFFCDKCTLNEFDKKPIKTQCSETIVELFDFTLDKLKDLKDEVVLSILFQILFAVASIQIQYGMFHNDIKKENILIKVIPSGGYWVYKLGNKKYYVPNHGYIVALNDFGVSLAYKPGISIKDYGRRQAEVVLNPNTNEYYFKPFTTKFFPSVSKTGSISRIDSPKLGGQFLTWNYFYKNFDSKPSIPIDLSDMERFPAFYFHFDILDVIYSFIGGKRTLQPGDHPAMKVSGAIKNKLKDFYKVKMNQVWPVDRVDLFLASHTIAKLFVNYTVKPSGGQIEEYSL
ncbi:hypothetical protein WIV_gp023 [Wiseana iridescent virus]|uniref:Protein kinase domain-containing protein n=1 Tax=Wiseana iridescent virus TaxID=68347 RepID=G0T549_IRV9|nr:hypothetical protein WIV_gp023 [Wiseana iridescent virus]ADO00366.1 hypothetical protein [Wiseana iridescent virus]